MLHSVMLSKQSFFHLRIKDRQIRTRGVHSCTLGHPIAQPKGAKPHGIYAQWNWDGQRLTVVNDRYGFYPLYYYWYQNELCISSSIPTILKHVSNRDFDFEGLAVFLRLGFFIGDHTPFKHIKTVPPNATFIWEDGTLTVKGDIFVCPEKAISLDQATDKYLELFRQAIKRHLPQGEFMSLLSGGRDSRFILLELNHLGYKPKICLTTHKYPPYGEDDMKYAAELTRLAGMNHVIRHHTRPRIYNELRSFRNCDFCSDEHTWIIDALDHVKGQVNIVYDGIGGDLSAIGSQYPEHMELMRCQSYEPLALKLLGGWGMPPERIFQHILNPDFYKKISIECASASLIKEFKRHQSLENPANSFYFWNRTRREIALSPYGLFDFQTVHAPYLDHDFFDFNASLPLQLSRDRSLQTHVIQKAHPKFAHIPFAKQKNDQNIAEHYRTFNRDVALQLLFKDVKTHSKVLNMRFLFPYLFKGLIKPQSFQYHEWLPPLIILYLSELEKEAYGH